MSEPTATPGASRRHFLATLCIAAPGLVTIPPAFARPAADDAWESLFDGRTLGAWSPTEFGGEGDVTVEDGRIVLATGNDLTGITWTGAKLPTTGYEIALRAMRLSGADFFCGLTFPVQSSFCSFIAGGWTGTIVGLSTVDGLDASANETKVLRVLDDNRWYAIRVRVTADRIEAWIDDARVVSLAIAGRKLTVRPEVADSRPLGIASYRTRAALDDIRLRRL